MASEIGDTRKTLPLWVLPEKLGGGVRPSFQLPKPLPLPLPLPANLSIFSSR